MPHEPQTEALHKEMLILLKKFHDFCMTNDIKYSLHGGTLLGAIREKGFIPWDDDIDVTLTREEFEKFYIAVRRSKKVPFKYVNSAKAIKLLRKGKTGNLVWIDVFIYDYITENILLQKVKFMILTFIKAWAKESDTFVETRAHGLYTGWKYFAIKVVYIFGKLFPRSFKQKVADKAYKSFPGRKQLIHRANDQYIAIKLILPTSSMINYDMIDFEDTRLMVTSDYDLVLRTSYGDDYMTPKKFDNDIKAHLEYRKTSQN